MNVPTDMDILVDILTESDMTETKFKSLLFKMYDREYMVIGKDKIPVIYKFSLLQKAHDLNYFTNLPKSVVNKRGHFCKNKSKKHFSKSINIKDVLIESRFCRLKTNVFEDDNKLLIINGNNCHNFEIKYNVFKLELPYLKWISNYHHILAIHTMSYLPDDVKKLIIDYIILKMYNFENI